MPESTTPPAGAQEVERIDDDTRVSDHLSEEVKSVLKTGEAECVVVSRRIDAETSEVVHLHDNEVAECPLWGVLISRPEH